MQCLKLDWARIEKTQFAVYISNTPVIFNQCHSHQVWYETADIKQSYHHTKFEKPHLNDVSEKANVKIFVYQKAHYYLP